MTNEKIVDAIRDLFTLLAEHNAILGRTPTHIVLDRQAMPGVVDVLLLADYELVYETPKAFAKRVIFSDVSHDEKLLLLDVEDIEKARPNDQYFAGELVEIRALFGQFRPLSALENDAVAECLAAADGLWREHGREALEAVLSGDIEVVGPVVKH